MIQLQFVNYNTLQYFLGSLSMYLQYTNKAEKLAQEREGSTIMPISSSLMTLRAHLLGVLL